MAIDMIYLMIVLLTLMHYGPLDPDDADSLNWYSNTHLSYMAALV